MEGDGKIGSKRKEVEKYKKKDDWETDTVSREMNRMTEKEQEVDEWTEALDKPTHTDIRTYRQSES